MALATLGVRFIAICAEDNDEAALLVSAGFPDAVHLVKVEEFKAQMLVPLLDKRKCQGVIVAGGAVCQPNSIINKLSAGLDNPWAPPHKAIINAAKEIGELPQAKGLQILELFENPVSRPEVQAAHKQDFGGEGVIINAAVFGWVWRRRIFYGRGPKGTFESLTPEGAQEYLPSQASLLKNPGAVPTLKWKGKPVPDRIRWRGGFQAGFEAADVVANNGKGAMFTFTRCCQHPDDHPASATVRKRAKEDGNRFPTQAYEERSLLSKQAGESRTFRPPVSAERAEVHCFPSSMVEEATFAGTTPSEEEGKRCSLVGNGYHIPSVMIALILLSSLQLVDPHKVHIQYPLSELWETRLRSAVQGTVFEPGVCETFPGVYTSSDLTIELWELFKPLNISQLEFDKWADTFESKATSKALATLQIYWVDACARGRSSYEQGPDWRSQRRRAEYKAVLSEQRGSSISKKGIAALVTPGMGKELHIRNALNLSSPFSMDAAVDDDLLFAARCCAIFGPQIRSFRARQSKAFDHVCKKLNALDIILKAKMHVEVAQVASKKSPATMGAMTILLRWPDREQPGLYVKGFRMVGNLEPSKVFRDNPNPKANVDPDNIQKEFLGPAAEQWVSDLEASQPRWADVDDIYRHTVKEQAAGYCGPFASRHELDLRYGSGGWRPQRRFMITQAGGKRRAIDDASRSGHNAATINWEAIFTVNCEFPVLAARTLIREILKIDAPSCDLAGPAEGILHLIPEWLDIVQFLQDMVDAYRQVPSDPHQAHVMQIAVWVPGSGWKYTQMYGNPFGMASAVLNFNRLPTLNVSFCRRAMGVLCAAYFDDNLGVDMTVANKSGELAVINVFTKAGSCLNPDKAMPPAPRRVFLGADIDLGAAARQGTCTVDLKEHTKEDLIKFMDSIKASKVFGSGKAAKLRGLIGWAHTGIHGKCARGGQAALMDRQYNDSLATDIQPKHIAAFDYHKLLLQMVPPRHLQIVGAPGRPVVIYSDAFFKPYDEPAPADGIRCRMGWILFDPLVANPVGGTMSVPDSLLCRWKARNQQVFIAETLAVLAATLLHQDVLRNRDVVWFVDNIGALQVLIKGNSSQFDAGNACAAAHLYWAAAGTRVWFEWVASNDNPSDGLSRDGLHDTWTMAQEPHWSVQEYEAPEWFALIDLPIAQLKELFTKKL